MKKSPEDYFSEQDFSVESPEQSGLTPAERAFMEKYMGVDGGAVLESIGLPPPGSPDVPGVPGQERARDDAAEEPLDDLLKSEPEIQMVGFFICGQEFTIPPISVQEVIRAIPVAKLPSAPPLVAGVINLRGKVTPLLELRDILGVSSPREGEDKFIIVCRRMGLQVGMIIERVHTMYRVSQTDIEWGIEAHIGTNPEFISGLFKSGERLVGIVSVDRVIAGIL